MVGGWSEEVNMVKFSVVCGLHRSGTTFVGEILKCAGVTVIHEPLNERYGMKDVPIAYPFVEHADDSMARLLDDVVHLARPWSKDLTYINARGLKRKFYAVTGGKSGLRWGGLRLLKGIGLNLGKVCLKDPFMSLATPYLVNTHGLRVVCMVRHPAAIHHSTVKQGWWFDVNNLRKQVSLVEKYGQDIHDAHWEMAKQNHAASIALLWKLMIRVNARLKLGSENILIVTHESLCQEPERIARQICEHLNVQFSNKVERYVLDNSEGDRAEAKNGRTHDFARNSRAIPDVWKGKVDAADLRMILDIAGEEIFSVYGM